MGTQSLSFLSKIIENLIDTKVKLVKHALIILSRKLTGLIYSKMQNLNHFSIMGNIHDIVNFFTLFQQNK